MPGVPAPDLRNISGVASRSDNRGSDTDVLVLGASDDLSEVVAAVGTENTAPIYQWLVRDKSQDAKMEEDKFSRKTHWTVQPEIQDFKKSAISSTQEA